MANVRLFGETSGFVELAAPNAAGNNTITLPTTGTELVASDGTGSTTLAGTVTASGLTVDGTATFAVGASGTPAIAASGDTNTGIYFPAADTIGFAEGGNEAARFDSSGRLLVGTTTAFSSVRNAYESEATPTRQTYVATATNSVNNGFGIYNFSSSGFAPNLDLCASKNNTVGSHTIVSSDQALGHINFGGSDGTQFRVGATILAAADGTPGASDMPGKLVFSTTADGASSPTERMRLTNDGYMRLGDGTTYYHTIRGAGGNNSLEFTANAGQQNAQSAGITTFSNSNAGGAITEQLKIDNLGNLFSYRTYANSSAQGANVGIAAGGNFFRSTSSGKYKTAVETIQDSYADALLGCRPVWYRSLCEGDNSEHSYWGFIAEEVAAVDPRLVHWKTVEITHDEDGKAIEIPCDPEPEGVAYERFVPHLINLVKRQKDQIASLEARLTALESA